MNSGLITASVCFLLIGASVAGFAAPLLIARLVNSYLPTPSQRLADSMACSIIESLVQRSDGSPSARVPAFVLASSNRGSDFQRKLNSSGQFKVLCKVVSALGMFCLPGYRYLQQRSR